VSGCVCVRVCVCVRARAVAHVYTRGWMSWYIHCTSIFCCVCVCVCVCVCCLRDVDVFVVRMLFKGCCLRDVV